MSRFVLAAAGACAVFALVPDATAFGADPAQPGISSGESLSIPDLVSRIQVPYQSFTLTNGLHVVVHEDRRVPVVAVRVLYNVGSKDEPPGRTGFAHLFEHLMFNGSENAPGDYFAHTAELGATDLNGTTSFDRTEYHETVPTGALARALFLESDRMGHLIGAINQETLVNQIAVVQNEKRQRETRPFGLVQDTQFADLLPEGHPYRHSPFGSMEDLSSATLADVRQWFRTKYGPNNAVLVLAGDINAAEARPLVERFFGDIPRGADNEPAAADVPTLAHRVEREIQDRIANPRIQRSWIGPGIADRDIVPLQVAASILGGRTSSRLDSRLVRDEQSAANVSAGLQRFQRLSLFDVQVDIRAGQDVTAVNRRLDEVIEEFIREGPTEAEVERTVMTSIAGSVGGLENVEARAAHLSEGMLLANEPGLFMRQLDQLSHITATDVRAAMQRWLSRPVYALTVTPGERERSVEPATVSNPTTTDTDPLDERRITRTPPPITETRALDFPAIERARLSNGIEIAYARGTSLPVTRIMLEFDAGLAADAPRRAGIHRLMLNLLPEGTTTRTPGEIIEAQERHGASISALELRDRAILSLTALSFNLSAPLDLLADIARNPAFAPEQIERLRAQRLAGIASARTRPDLAAGEAVGTLLFGDHPYGRSSIGDAQAVRSVTRDELIQFHRTWIRPDNVRIFAVGDLPLNVLLPQLEARFGNWLEPAVARGIKSYDAPLPEVTPRIVVIDRPQSQQSFILASQVLSLVGTDDRFALDAANEILAGDFLARINMELRERRGWSYGVRGGAPNVEHQVPFQILAPVQADRTGESIAVIREQVRAFLGAHGVEPSELNRVVLGNIRRLPGQFPTASAILQAMRTDSALRRPDDYWETIADRYRGLSASQLDDAARRYIHPDRFVWVVVGDAAIVRPQLERLGLPIETVRPD